MPDTLVCNLAPAPICCVRRAAFLPVASARAADAPARSAAARLSRIGAGARLQTRVSGLRVGCTIGRGLTAQFTNVPSKSHVRCVPSQKGLLLERPQRHIANCGGSGISRPSGAVRWTGPETRYGPFSLGVMVTSSIQSTSPFELVDLDRSRHGQPTNADASQCENRISQRWRNRRDADLTNTRR